MQSSINVETVYVTSHCMEPLQNTLQLREGRGRRDEKQELDRNSACSGI